MKSAIRQRNCQRSVHTSICLIIGASGLVHYCDVTCNCVIFSRKHNYISMPLWTRLISIYSSIVFYWLVQFTIDVSVPYANGIWDKHSEATLKFHRRFGIIAVRLLSNRRKILSYQHPISWLGDFKKTGGKTSICKMNRGPDTYHEMMIFRLWKNAKYMLIIHIISNYTRFNSSHKSKLLFGLT